MNHFRKHPLKFMIFQQELPNINTNLSLEKSELHFLVFSDVTHIHSNCLYHCLYLYVKFVPFLTGAKLRKLQVPLAY